MCIMIIMMIIIMKIIMMRRIFINTSPESDCTDWGSCGISRCLERDEQIIASNHQTHTLTVFLVSMNL